MALEMFILSVASQVLSHLIIKMLRSKTKAITMNDVEKEVAYQVDGQSQDINIVGPKILDEIKILSERHPDLIVSQDQIKLAKPIIIESQDQIKLAKPIIIESQDQIKLAKPIIVERVNEIVEQRRKELISMNSGDHPKIINNAT